MLRGAEQRSRAQQRGTAHDPHSISHQSESHQGWPGAASAASTARAAGRRSARCSRQHANTHPLPHPGEALPYIASASEEPGGRMAISDLLGNMLSGGIAGSTVETALYPLDTIKTRLQARTSVTSIQLKGLYSGLAGNIVGVIPSSALFFGSYEPIKKQLASLLPSGYSSVAQLSAAAAAGTIASLVRVPTEVIKTRMQTKQFNGPIMAVSSIAAKEGVGGLYAGYWSFMLRDLPFDAIEFVTYEQAKIAYSRFIVKRDVNPAEASFLGALAGSFTGVVTTPLDVVKTRLMTQGLKAQYAGVFDCMGKIARSEGIGALFKGGAARATWLSLGGSIFFTSLEMSQALLVSEEGRKQQGSH